LETDWDKRHREGFYTGAYEPHELTRRCVPLMPRGKPVIDVAMGQGRDLIYLTGLGFEVFGLEKSGEALRLARETAEWRRMSSTIERFLGFDPRSLAEES